jgi:uncharacterized protein (DUF58 family)
MATVTAPPVFSTVKDTISGWVKQRVRTKRGPMTPPFELEYRHIFVLPTKFGWGFGVMLVFMALGGLNFNNNMALILVFLLATIAQLTTMIAYRNLSGLKLDTIHSEPVFTGEDAHFRLFVSNGDVRQRFAIQAGFKRAQDCKDFKLNSCESFVLTQTTTKRGWLEMPSFKLETRFPLGLFKAWSWIFPQSRCLVYPAPARKAPPLPNTGHGQTGRAVKGDGDEVHGLRKYQAGDSIQRVAWRASARHDELYSLEMETPRQNACELDWDSLKGNDTETRLSILTAWVIAADHKQLSYSLKLPGKFLPAGLGPTHRSQCLEALALYLL